MKPRLLSTTHLSFRLATAIAALLAAPAAFAAPYDWTGATNGTWNTNTNWSGSLVPTIADDLTILGPLNVAGALTIDFDADNSAKSLNFTNTAATSITNTTSGANKTLTLGSGGITTGSGAVQIGSTTANQAVNITLGAAQTWNVGAGGMTVTNLIDGLGTGLTKTGAGNLTINTGTANTFTGGLNVNRGTLTLDYNNLATPTNLVDATNALQINNGTLTITGKNVAAATTSQTFAGTTLGAGVNTINIAKGALATSATLNLGALTVNSGSSTIFSPTTAWTTTASTTEKVSITAGGSIPSLPGSGSAFVNAGVFHRVAGGAAGTLRLAAVNSSGQLLLKANAGNLAVGTGVDPTGSYQLNAGGIALTNTAASVYGLLLNATGAGTNITIANSGTLTLNSVIQIKATESVNIVAGTGTSNVVIGSEKNLVLAMDNTAGLAINAPIANNGSTGGVGGTASSVTILGTNPTGNPGTVTLGGANTYSGATTITRGTLNLTNVNALQNTSGLTLGGTSAATLTTQTDGITLAAPITTANSGISSTISFGVATAVAGSITLDGAIGGSGNVIFSTPNNNSGGNSQTINLGATATYAGSTTMTTGNANNTTLIKNTSGAANVLPTTTVLSMTGGTGTGSGRAVTFDLNGQNQELAGLQNTLAVDRDQRVSNSGALATLTINNSANFTFGGYIGSGLDDGSGQITGAIALTKKGAGTFTLASGIGNTFTGNTVVQAGILSVGHATSLQNSALDTTSSIVGDSTNGLQTTVTTLTMGGLTGNKDLSTVFTTSVGGYTDVAALTLNPSIGVTNSYSADIGNGNGSMTLTKSGLGTQVLTTTQTNTGATNINVGTLQLDGSTHASSTVGIGTAGSLTGSGTVNGNATLTAAASSTNPPVPSPALSLSPAEIGTARAASPARLVPAAAPSPSPAEPT